MERSVKNFHAKTCLKILKDKVNFGNNETWDVMMWAITSERVSREGAICWQ
jgi:hypothetical protein